MVYTKESLTSLDFWQCYSEDLLINYIDLKQIYTFLQRIIALFDAGFYTDLIKFGGFLALASESSSSSKFLT